MRLAGPLVVALLAVLPACKTGTGLPDVGPPPPITTLRDAAEPDDTVPVLDIRASDSLNGQPVVRAGGTGGPTVQRPRPVRRRGLRGVLGRRPGRLDRGRHAARRSTSSPASAPGP